MIVCVKIILLRTACLSFHVQIAVLQKLSSVFTVIHQETLVVLAVPHLLGFPLKMLSISDRDIVVIRVALIIFLIRKDLQIY